MGSPKINTRKKSSERPELTVPRIAEKMRLLELGRSARGKSVLDNLVPILDAMKDFLLPLVQWLDVDLSQTHPFTNPKLPEGFEKRALPVFLDEWAIQLSFALDRAGHWIIKDDGKYFVKDSEGLSRFIVWKKTLIIKASLGHPRDELVKFLDENLVCLNLAKRHSIVWLLGECHKRVEAQLKAREERMEIMRKRMDAFADFGPSFDPIGSSGAKLLVPNFCIFQEYAGGGSRNVANSYMSPKALKPFWKAIKERYTSPAEQARFRLNSGNRHHDSLGGLLKFIEYDLKEIAYAKKADCMGADRLLGSSSGRLPLDPEELKILQAIIESVEGD